MSAVKVEGLNELVRNLRKVQKDLPKGMKEIHSKVVEPVVRSAQRNVNSKSGKLAASIKPSATQRVGRVSAGTRLKYAGVNHYGWPGHNITGNPFLTDAVTSQSDKVLNEYDKLLGVFIEKVWVDNF